MNHVVALHTPIEGLKSIPFFDLLAQRPYKAFDEFRRRENAYITIEEVDATKRDDYKRPIYNDQDQSRGRRNRGKDRWKEHFTYHFTH